MSWVLVSKTALRRSVYEVRAANLPPALDEPPRSIHRKIYCRLPHRPAQLPWLVPVSPAVPCEPVIPRAVFDNARRFTGGSARQGKFIDAHTVPIIVATIGSEGA